MEETGDIQTISNSKTGDEIRHTNSGQERVKREADVSVNDFEIDVMMWRKKTRQTSQSPSIRGENVREWRWPFVGVVKQVKVVESIVD